jgi:glycosyltransferase involved in cell wall biosynthesis
VVDKPNLFTNPAVIAYLEVPRKMYPNSPSNTYSSAHRCTENSKNCWPKGIWREGIRKNKIRDQPPKSNRNQTKVSIALEVLEGAFHDCPFTIEIGRIQSVRLSMKILHVTGPLHREFGGPPLAATGVASSLATLGHQVKILVCGQSVQDFQTNSVFFEKLSHSGVEVSVLQRSRESKYGTFFRFHELKSLWSDINKSDFIILHQVFELQHIAIFPILIILKKHFAVMPHGTLTTYQRRQHRFRKFLFAPATYSFLKSADSIFVATEHEKNQLPRFLQSKGNIVGLGIEMRDRQTGNPANSSPTFNLLFMGRIAKKKRLDIALQAFALASKKSDLKMKFIVCGSGEERYMSQLKELVVDLHIEAQVEFRGWVDFNEKQQAFLESDCFILTSEDENFAIAAAEALAHGVPCILSSNVALASLVSKHSAGIIFEELAPPEIGKAIKTVSGLDRELVKNSSLRAASELSWDSIAKQWETGIEKLLKD